MGFILSVFLGLAPMLAFAIMVGWLDRDGKQPRILLVAAFAWGAIVAAGGAYLINSLLGTSIYTATGSPDASRLATGSVIAPIVEESLKGAGILLIFLLFTEKISTVTDGVLYAGITALGFAATENFYYIYTYGFREQGLTGILSLFLIRVILVGWQHPFFTMFTGIGLANSLFSRGFLFRLAAPILGWTSAVLFHSIHNSLADILSGRDVFFFSAALDWSGWILLALFVGWMVVKDMGISRRQIVELYRKK